MVCWIYLFRHIEQGISFAWSTCKHGKEVRGNIKMREETSWTLKKKLLRKSNVIHYITNPIAMNDCANALLAIGAKPIMAQHPKECVQITSQSKALALNLGNFDDIRATSMQYSSAYARQHQIPIIIDVVGIGCSDIRLTYAQMIIKQYHPAIVKGNLSELKALAGKTSHACGIDVGIEDLEDVGQSSVWIKKLAETLSCVILCTGKSDIISDGKRVHLMHNGHEMMSRITGTGCMLTGMCAAYASIDEAYEAAIFATTLLNIAAEKSYTYAKTPGQFHIALFDWLYSLDEEEIRQMMKIEEVVYEI